MQASHLHLQLSEKVTKLTSSNNSPFGSTCFIPSALIEQQLHGPYLYPDTLPYDTAEEINRIYVFNLFRTSRQGHNVKMILLAISMITEISNTIGYLLLGYTNRNVI